MVSVTVFINFAKCALHCGCLQNVYSYAPCSKLSLQVDHYSTFLVFLDFPKEKGKINFPILMTTEEFKNKLEEIYPRLKNQCYLLMKAAKSNKLQNLDIASSSYNPKDIYNSNLGQGKLYIRFATEAEVMS